MLFRNVIAVAWFALGIVAGYWGYKALARRFGRRWLGRLAANSAMMIGWFWGLFGFRVLWNGGHADAGWHRGSYVGAHDWQWPEAVGYTLAPGPLIGLLLTWLRRPRSYGFDIPSDEPLLDADEVQEILEVEGEMSATDSRELAASLVERAWKQQQPLPRELRAFVERHLPKRHPVRWTRR